MFYTGTNIIILYYTVSLYDTNIISRPKIIVHHFQLLPYRASFFDYQYIINVIIITIMIIILETVFGTINKDTYGTLTHILPYVSKKFQSICHTSDTLWLETLARLLQNDPKTWKRKLLYIMNHDTLGKKNPPWSSFYNANIDQNDFMMIATIQNLNQFTSQEEIKQLLTTIQHSITRNIMIPTNSSNHPTPPPTTSNSSLGSKKNPYNFILYYNISNFNKLLYMNMIVKYKQTSLPIIEISTKIHILKPFNLTLFGKEQLCILEFLTKDLLQTESITFHQSTTTHATSIPSNQRPRFLLATRRKSIKIGTMVIVSELQTCTLNPINRAAHISIVPIHKTKLLGLQSSSSSNNHPKKINRGTKKFQYGLVNEPRME